MLALYLAVESLDQLDKATSKEKHLLDNAGNVFNNRLQLTQVQLGTIANASSVLELNYSYDNVNPNTHDNNGNLKQQQIKAPGMEVTQTYTCITLTANDVPLNIQTSYRYNRLDDLIGWLL